LHSNTQAGEARDAALGPSHRKGANDPQDNDLPTFSDGRHVPELRAKGVFPISPRPSFEAHAVPPNPVIYSLTAAKYRATQLKGLTPPSTFAAVVPLGKLGHKGPTGGTANFGYYGGGYSTAFLLDRPVSKGRLNIE
jgi:hypothetical protein